MVDARDHSTDRGGSGSLGHVDIPDIHYARAADGVRIAYQLIGSGPPTVIVPPYLSNIEIFWEHELYRRVLERMAAHVTVVHFDKRGMGASDRFDEAPTLDERIADMVAVMDAVGFERANVLGSSEGGLMAQQFAWRHPERVDRLVLNNSLVGQHPDLTIDGEYLTELLRFFGAVFEQWGEDPTEICGRMMPSQADNESFVRWFGRLQRQACTAEEAQRQFLSLFGLESPPLEELTMPTLVVQCTGDRVVPTAFAHHLAARIPDAELVEYESDDHFNWVGPRWREMLDLVLEFLSGAAPLVRSERRFATILFTDLVGSTARTVAEGDADWRRTLDSHDRICHRVVERFRGRIVKSTGDGLLATFDAPTDGVEAARALAVDLDGIGLAIRAGLHTGEVEVHDSGDVSGIAVNLAARVEQAAEDGAVFVTSTVRELLLGGDLSFDDRGEHAFKGFDSPWRLFAVAT